LISVPIEKISDVLDKAVPSLMEDDNVTGMSIIVIRGGKIAISKSFGYADTEYHRAIDEHTVFRAASLGKPIFSYIVVSLAKQGKIDLDAPLYSYYKEEVVKGDPCSRLISARMVLDHTTGLPNLDENGSEVKFLIEPGTSFEYSGHAYLYLQRVIEKVTGKRLNQLANEIVFQHLVMTDSSYVWQDRYSVRVSGSYDKSGEEFSSKEKPARGYSAWCLYTTTMDYTFFVSHMIKTASIQGSVAEAMLKPQVDVAKNVKWSLGWGLQDTVPIFSFWHWGSMAGFRHYVAGYPKERMGVIVMTNSSSAFKMVDNVMAKAIGGSFPSYDWF
jgi:CubicO group peptidase (beta-lactamase class C family)